MPLDPGARPGGDGARAQHRADHGDDLRIGQRLAQPHQVVAGDVAGLVCQHADHLSGRFRIGDHADIDEDAPRVGDEGVEVVSVDQHDVDLLAGDAGRVEDRPGIVAHQGFRFRIAHQRDAALRLRGRAHGGERQHAGHGQRRARAQQLARRAGVHRGRSRTVAVGRAEGPHLLPLACSAGLFSISPAAPRLPTGKIRNRGPSRASTATRAKGREPVRGGQPLP